MAILTREQILESIDLKTKTLDVQEWGGEVIIQTISAAARDKFEASLIGKNGGHKLENHRAKFCALCIVDDKGQLLFSEKDLIALGKKSCAALDMIYDAAEKLNHMRPKDVDDSVKNS